MPILAELKVDEDMIRAVIIRVVRERESGAEWSLPELADKVTKAVVFALTARSLGSG